ncbi:MAG: 4Fe-4S dicluster domain-containing protein, partial [Polaromonas sp.]|nr:4Fe-4S dicluster domain-containing protein [Polaromonas sp.]
MAPAPAIASAEGESKHRWAMVVDVQKCIGCQACTVSCIMENDVPANSFRTVTSTYEVHDGKRTGTYMLPRLCNHCDEPPCIPVCPVGATFQRKDGIVVVDGDRCVGCAYCVQACPYDARFINHDTGKADKCTFCAHRVDAGLLPACVETCVGGARIFGDLNDPKG